MSLRDQLEKVEQYTVEIINGRSCTRWDRLYRAFLFFLSHAYRLAVQLRMMLYDNAVLRRQNLGSFVVSVGNLTVGGTGKTPVVELLARTLAARRRRIAILSRGYRSRPRTWREKLVALFHKEHRLPPKVVSDGSKVLLDSQQAGDEPYMLARNLLATEGRTGVAVIVDKDRVYGGQFAISRYGVDTLLLDDGFQYLRLRPRINIVLVDTTNPFHNHEMLPVGLLREPIEDITRADYIFLTKSSGKRNLERLRSFLHRHNPKAPVIECNHEPRHLQDLLDGTQRPLETLRGKKVAAICGIAVPESFERYLEQLGATIVYRKRFVDHHRYKESEIRDFHAHAAEAGAEILLTTEKDAVRIPNIKFGAIPFVFLRVEINILHGQEHFDDCIRRICMR
ncbi:MAG: tetraacyldisaccharide 4'-kinase [Victivallales bacterium]|nr:tetraacyldisaccharide 4'-kinase [Victivallales bacterium]